MESEGRSPLELKAFWQSCEESQLKYFVFLNIFIMFTCCIWSVSDLHAHSPEDETAVSFNFFKDERWNPHLVEPENMHLMQNEHRDLHNFIGCVCGIFYFYCYDRVVVW